MGRHLTFGGRYILPARVFLRLNKRKKSHGVYQENRVDVLESSHPLHQNYVIVPVL